MYIFDVKFELIGLNFFHASLNVAAVIGKKPPRHLD